MNLGVGDSHQRTNESSYKISTRESQKSVLPEVPPALAKLNSRNQQANITTS